MGLTVHIPHPGTALIVTEKGSVLLGAPADAFKATKSYCGIHQLPFPRVLVAPQKLLAEATPQFNPEFFLYEFLFVYGAAFKPDLAAERLHVVVDRDQYKGLTEALRITLTGPTRAEMAGYRGSAGACMPPSQIEYLATISEHMAIRKGDKPREIEDSIAPIFFDAAGCAKLLGDALILERDGPQAFIARYGEHSERIDLTLRGPLVPFARLKTPASIEYPMTFGAKALGTRNGFDLSGPTTGFVIWLNGRAVIYDGPVGSTYLLRSQGISPDDIDAIILSHCHEDHMGAFTELLLAGRRPKVMTAEPIYRSALVKLASFFGESESAVARYIDYVPVVPGEALDALGATFDFFYTVHSIPTVGVNVSMRHRGQSHSIQISGDTMHHDGLDAMLAQGVITPPVHERMRNLIPKERIEGATYFADVGEAMIHGHPKDWAGNPNSINYYHCADNDNTRQHGHHVSAPGESVRLIEHVKIHPLAPARVLKALSFLDVDDPRWMSRLLVAGRCTEYSAGEVVIDATHVQTKPSDFSVIIAGSATVSLDGATIAQLTPGDYFGAVDVVDERGASKTQIAAETPLEVFTISGHLFFAYVQEAKRGDVLERVLGNQTAIASARIFRRLDRAVRDKLAGFANEVHFAPGDVLLQQASKKDDFFILCTGEVALDVDGKEIARVKADDSDNFVGEARLLDGGRAHPATVRAATQTHALHIEGAKARQTLQDFAGVHYVVEVALKRRT